MELINKLKEIEASYRELEKKMADPEIVNDPHEMQQLGKKHVELTPIVDAFSEYEKVLNGIAEAKEMAEGDDEEMRELAKDELAELEARVPETEASGRIHTSTATVAVLPEAAEVDVEIRPEDLKIDTYRSSGAGGQHVNMTDSAVRITHLPTGIVVTCQDERSQIKNRAKAMQFLRTKLYDAELQRQNAELAAERKGQVGTGDRAERIRTYNFPQNRLTDHRINLTLYKLDQILDGDLYELIRMLTEADQAEKLKALSV